MKLEIKRIRIWSAVKTGFFVSGMLGFLFGVYVALMMPALLRMVDGLGPLAGEIGSITPVALIFMPIFYSIAGAVVGTCTIAVVAGFYNLISALIGGLSIELDGDPLNPLEVSMTDRQQPPESEN
jgi:hypothetical protein